MKRKTTKKATRASYKNCIYTGYCWLNRLLRLEEPTKYTTRAEGWGADIYHIDSTTAIITGYDPFGNIRADYAICKKYEEKAKKVLERTYKRNDYKCKKRALNKLISQFVDEVTRG